MMTVVDDLKAAKQELIKRGRCKGYLLFANKVCLLGAIGMVTQEDFEEHCRYDEGEAFIDLTKSPRALQIVAALAPYLDKTLSEEDEGVDDFFERVFHFNDHKATDQDVLNLFDKALADLGGIF